MTSFTGTANIRDSVNGITLLVFLASGDPALTRRAKKHSTLSALVLKWSRARNRYERQGLLVEAQGLEEAERECLSDSEARARRREREAERRSELDRAYVRRFASRVRELFPKCPSNREFEIAEFACRKYSGRVGRSAGARSLAGACDFLGILGSRPCQTATAAPRGKRSP